MAWKKVYRIYRNFAILFHISIFLIIFIAIFPVAMKSITVEDVGKEKWTFDGKFVYINIPVTLKNGGAYNINDLKVYFKVDNASNNFIDSSQRIGNIPYGSEKKITIRIPIDMEKIYNLEYPSFYHFYNHDTFHIKFSFSLKYMLNLVDFETDFNDDVHWEPIIKEFITYHPSVINENGSEVKIIIPYTINTASYLTGDAEFSGKVRGLNSVGTFSTKFPLGKKYDGNLEMLFPKDASKSLLTHSQNLHLSGNFSLMGFRIPMEKDYYWGAPFNNLKFEVLSNGTLHYSFENDADFDMSLHITKDFYNGSSLVYHEEEYIIVNSGESVNKYEEIPITQRVDKVVITMTDDNTGIQYREVLNL